MTDNEKYYRCIKSLNIELYHVYFASSNIYKYSQYSDLIEEFKQHFIEL